MWQGHSMYQAEGSSSQLERPGAAVYAALVKWGEVRGFHGLGRRCFLRRPKEKAEEIKLFCS